MDNNTTPQATAIRTARENLLRLLLDPRTAPVTRYSRGFCTLHEAIVGSFPK